MEKMITATVAGGAYLGPKNDTPRTTSADEMKELAISMPQKLGTSKIKFKDGKSSLYVIETVEEITTKMNGEPKPKLSFSEFGK